MADNEKNFSVFEYTKNKQTAYSGFFSKGSRYMSLDGHTPPEDVIMIGEHLTYQEAKDMCRKPKR